VLYVCALLKMLGRYDPVPLTITLDNERIQETIFLLSIGNGTTVGGGFRLTPHARLDDGSLDVTVVKPIGILPLLRHLPKVFLGTIDRVTRYAMTRRTARLVIESPDRVPVHIDGEIYNGGEKRFEIEVIPKALTVIGGF
jgi:diacylglycerol kinase family enzyme